MKRDSNLRFRDLSAPSVTARTSRLAGLLVAMLVTTAALAGPAATVACGQPTKNGSVTVKLFKWADKTGRHGVTTKVECTGIKSTDTPQQKAQKIARQLNAYFRKNHIQLHASVNGATVTIEDTSPPPGDYGVETTGTVDTTGEPTNVSNDGLSRAAIQSYRLTARLEGVPSEGFATLGTAGLEAMASTAVSSIDEIYAQWQDVLGGDITADGLLLPAMPASGQYYYMFNVQDPGLDIAIDTVRAGTVELTPNNAFRVQGGSTNPGSDGDGATGDAAGPDDLGAEN